MVNVKNHNGKKKITLFRKGIQQYKSRISWFLQHTRLVDDKSLVVTFHCSAGCHSQPVLPQI